MYRQGFTLINTDRNYPEAELNFTEQEEETADYTEQFKNKVSARRAAPTQWKTQADLLTLVKAIQLKIKARRGE